MMQRLVNEAGEFLISRPAWQLRLGAWLALLLIGTAIYDRQIHLAEDRGRDSALAETRDSLAAVTVLRLHRQKDAIGERIDRQTVTVTRTVHRLDTLWQQLPESLTTRAETVKVLDALPILRRSTDSAIAACSEFQISCAEYRRIADSLELALRSQNDALRARLSAVKPSRFGGVIKWGEIIGAAYIGFRVGAGR